MKKILSFTKIGILFTCLCLFSVGAFGAEAKTEPEWKIHQTVNRSFIELPDFYVPAPIIEELEPDTELKFFQEFNTSKNDKDTLAVFLLCTAPFDPNHINNFRFKYDFRSGDSAEAFAIPFQKDFSENFDFNSRWEAPKRKTINGKPILIMKGTVSDPQSGNHIFGFHEHYAWTNTNTSEVYVINFIYPEKSSENQKMIKRIINSFELPSNE
jgi:hypothetical protein